MLGELKLSLVSTFAFCLAGLGASGCASEQTLELLEQRQQAVLGYQQATWSEAHTSNFSQGDRGVGDIREVVVHTMEGSYTGSQSWFRDPVANVSAHYLIRSSDGDITQMVDDSDYAWHVFCLNETAIGLEHEGYLGEADTWYTDIMYEKSARLTAWLVNQYLIPIDREHILGHDESGCTTHGDPGPQWDWTKYMQLVEQYAVRSHDAVLVSVDAPEQLEAGRFENVTITLRNEGNYTWAKDRVQLGTQDPQDHVSKFSSQFWLAGNRAVGPVTTDNYAGEEIQFVFPVKAPQSSETTTLTETLQLTDPDGNWFGPKITFSIEVMGDGLTPEPQPSDEPEPSDEPMGDVGGGCNTSQQGALSSAWFMLLALLPWRKRRAQS